MNQPPLNPDAIWAAAVASRHALWDGDFCGFSSESDAQDYGFEEGVKWAQERLAAAQPEVTSVEELEALPVGAVVYASNHIGPAEKFAVGWMGCGNNAAWSSALLARDGLPARVLYRPEVKP